MLKYPLFYAGQVGSTFGWGVCNGYLIRELSKLTRVIHIEQKGPERTPRQLPGHVFAPLADHRLGSLTLARGQFNHGYTFFERDLTDESVANAGRLDTVFAGCTWCGEKLAEKGIPNVVLIQGVDGTVFRPQALAPNPTRFTLFSGGKFEYRKGQDLVLLAYRELSRRHPEVRLVCAWCNQWGFSIETMRQSPHIRYERIDGQAWEPFMRRIFDLNEIEVGRVEMLPLLKQSDMARVYLQTDLGVFPNRCEGGTNLVMMEYMACGKAVVATNATGHRDILTTDNAYPLDALSEIQFRDRDGNVAAHWVEPRVEDIVATVEAAMRSRAELATKGRQAAADLRAFTWERAARVVHDALHRAESGGG